MEVGEEDLAAAQQRILGRLRFLHLDDHLRPRPDFGSRHDDLGAGTAIVLVAEADGVGDPGLDDRRVAAMGEFADAGRRHADPVLLILDLPGNTDQHRRRIRQSMAFRTSRMVSAMRSICAGSTISGGDRAIVSPVVRTRIPRS